MNAIYEMNAIPISKSDKKALYYRKTMKNVHFIVLIIFRYKPYNLVGTLL